MSLFPSPVLVRLQELKLWQGNYDSLLQNRSKEGANPSDFETIEGLSALDSTHSTPLSSPERGKSLDWDKTTITPSKPFEQLLEEKLALDKPVSVQAKPKRPFLKKGSGLLRYKLSDQTVDKKRVNRNRLPVEQSGHNKQYKDKHLDKKCSSKTSPSKSCTKITKIGNHQREDTKIDFTPLKMPELVLPPKATWRTVLEEDNLTQKENVADPFKKLDDDLRIYKNKFNSHIIGKINDFNLKRLVPTSPRRSLISKKYTETIATIPECESEKSDANDQSTENELRIFEELEERVEHSSFSSSNSSILRLLSSTPNKAKNNLIPQGPCLGERRDTEGIPSGYHIQGIRNALLQRKLKEVNQRSDVLHDFLKNLRKIGNNERSSSNSSESAQERSPETSFSDEEKWSSQTDTETSRPSSSTFTDTIRNNSVSKIDASVNTSFSEKDKCLQGEEKCKNCEELADKLERVSKQLPDIQAEKAKVCDFVKELEAKRDQLFKDMAAMKQKHEDIVSDLKEELLNERKKFAREKLVFDMYIKDSQNRPTRKEREEIYQLKKELADAKELMKLKETKSGATQARLRTQVKQLEKENNELKQEVEKLQKDNAKLNATQLMRRPSEVKMLHEINKNLTKLTEETLKKQQHSKTDTSCNTVSPRELKQSGPRRSKPLDENSEQEKTPRGKKTPSTKNKTSESSSQSSNTDDISKFELTTFADIYLEKQYENAFAQGCIVSDNTLDDSKKDRNETVYEDGSKEIKYSNGNTKTISPDGNVVVVRYYNGDIKETNIMDNTLKYYYAESATWHMHYGDGSEMLEYPNGQREKIYVDGRKEVHCVDGSVLFLNPDGSEEIIYPDGSKLMKHLNGEKVLSLPNGQKEIHTRDHKRREYPDGTVKILYPDGTQETRYASGRIRIKDGNGVLIMDNQSQ